MFLQLGRTEQMLLVIVVFLSACAWFSVSYRIFKSELVTLKKSASRALQIKQCSVYFASSMKDRGNKDAS